MTLKLFDSELKVMDVLWKEGDMPAKQISDKLKETTGWNMNTTYTVIKKCIAKGAIERREPNFLCHALIGREQEPQGGQLPQGQKGPLGQPVEGQGPDHRDQQDEHPSRQGHDGASPLTYGVLRPVILLPEEMDGAVLPYVLTHEHDFLYFIMASILSSMANLLKWLQRGKLRASSRWIRVRA